MAILPPDISCLPYVIKQARFIKMVTPDTSLDYIISRNSSISAGQIEIVTVVQRQSKEVVAKINLIFKVGESNAS